MPQLNWLLWTLGVECYGPCLNWRVLIYSFVSAALPVAYCLAVLEFSVFSIQQLRKVGVFCHSAITGAEKDQDLLVQSLLQEKETFRERLLQLFKTFDDDGNGIITLFEFETRFQDESVRALFVVKLGGRTNRRPRRSPRRTRMESRRPRSRQWRGRSGQFRRAPRWARWTATATASLLWWAWAWGGCAAHRRCRQRASGPRS